MRKALIILVLLLGLVIGYLAGCRSHIQARPHPPDPAPGQSWHAPDGGERLVRCVVREAGQVWVWWHHPGTDGTDRRCTVETWQRWARQKGASP